MSYALRRISWIADPAVVQNSLGHGCDLLGLADTSCMGDIGLDDVDTSRLKVRAAVQTREQSFTELIMSALEYSSRYMLCGDLRQ